MRKPFLCRNIDPSRAKSRRFRIQGDHPGCGPREQGCARSGSVWWTMVPNNHYDRKREMYPTWGKPGKTYLLLIFGQIDPMETEQIEDSTSTSTNFSPVVKCWVGGLEFLEVNGDLETVRRQMVRVQRKILFRCWHIVISMISAISRYEFVWAYGWALSSSNYYVLYPGYYRVQWVEEI